MRISMFIAAWSAVFMFVPPVSAADSNLPTSWVVYYSDQAPTSAFEPYDLVVLDSDVHPRLQPLHDRGKTLLGYLSLGEVADYRAHFSAVAAEGLLLKENPNWPGSHYVDLRNPLWAARVVEELIPGILVQGFDGIFLDTLDNAETLEREHPHRHAGMTEAAAALVRAIRMHYPEITIMLNRAYVILPDVAGSIDMVLGESMYADYDFDTDESRVAPDDSYLHQVELLEVARAGNPDLLLLSLDYWNPEDSAGVARIYAVQRSHGLIPYVATIGLDHLVPEPKP